MGPSFFFNNLPLFPSKFLSKLSSSFPTHMESKPSFRVLMFPWLAHGHVFPFLELAKILSKKNFQIYLCSTSINLESAKKNLRDDSSIEMVELQLPAMADLPPQYHTTKNIPPHLMPTLMEAFQNSSSTFCDIFRDVKPDLLIYDWYQPWAAKFAQSQGIPAVLFSTSGATMLAFFHHSYTYKSYDTFPYPAIYLRDHEKLAHTAQVESIKVKDAGENFAYGVFQLSYEIVLMKSCKVIEGKYIDYLSELCNKKIVHVGPLLAHVEEENDSEILNWLSHKEQCSALYISFGSENYLSKEQMREIAKGLELSNINFIWVVRFPNGSGLSVEEVLPEGFLDRVKGRGIVEGAWAPQAKILAHSSVGGFMSHCGWSSVMESLYFAVPLVAVPLKLDQPVNCRLVVEAGVGVEVGRDESGDFDAEGVAEAISKVIVEGSGERLRCKARSLSEKMKLEQEQAFDEVAKELSSICMKRNDY